MERAKLTAATAAVLCATTLAGCGLSNPYQGKRAAAHSAASWTTTSARTTTPAAATSTATTATLPTTTPSNLNADPPSERDGTVPAAVRAAENRVRGAGSPTARAAVRRYARLYINWTASTLQRDQRKLAKLAIGAARLQAQQAAATGASNPQLKRDHVSNRGEVVSISPGSQPAEGLWVIVTSETTGGQGQYQGLPAELHVTYAKVTHTRQGWVISQWMPQT
jgi:hypothetical protein